MANFLKSLFVKGVEIDTAGAITGDVLKYNGTKFGAASAGGGSSVGDLDDLTDVVITSPATGSTLYFDGTNWIDSTTLIPNVSDTLVGRNTTDTLTNKTLTTPTINGPTITATGQTPVIHGILLPNTHGIYFEGATTDANQTYLYCVDPTADRTILLPDAGGTVALLGTIALGTDTTGNYMSGISGTSPVSVAHTAGEGSSATVSLAASYGDTQNPYASKTANYVLAAPNGTAGVPTFRAIVAADIPTLNQNTTGTAATVTGAAQTAITSVGPLTALTVSGNLTVDTSTLFVDATNNRVGIGTASPSSFLHVASGALGGTAGNELIATQVRATNSNQDIIYTKYRRVSTGADWTTAQAKIQRTIDATDMGYVAFGGTAAFDVRIGSGTTDIATFVSGGVDIVGNVALTGSVVFEGATADAFETTLSVTDPTADRTITLPNASGTVALITVSDTAPTSPVAGNLWYKSNTGAMYVYYDSFWIEVGSPSSGLDGGSA